MDPAEIGHVDPIQSTRIASRLQYYGSENRGYRLHTTIDWAVVPPISLFHCHIMGHDKQQNLIGAMVLLKHLGFRDWRHIFKSPNRSSLCVRSVPHFVQVIFCRLATGRWFATRAPAILPMMSHVVNDEDGHHSIIFKTVFIVIYIYYIYIDIYIYH
jgi:hypothetical protein